MPGQFCCRTCKSGTPCWRLVHDGFVFAEILHIRGRRESPVDPITEDRLEVIEDTASQLRNRVSQLEGQQRMRAAQVRTASAALTAAVLDESQYRLPNHYGGFGPPSDAELLAETSLEATPVVIEQPIPVVHAAAADGLASVPHPGAETAPFSLQLSLCLIRMMVFALRTAIHAQTSLPILCFKNEKVASSVS